MGIFGRIKDFMLQREYEDDYDDYAEEVGRYERERGDDDIPYIDSGSRRAEMKKGDTIALSPVSAGRGAEKSSGSVYSISPAQHLEVVVSTPTDFDTASTICDLLKQNKAVQVLMTKVDTKTGQRIIDLLSGITIALEGDIQQIHGLVYLAVPKGVEITEHHKQQLKDNGLFAGFGGRKAAVK